MPEHLTRDRLAVLAGLAAPVAVAAVLVPFRTSFPNTDGALAMVLVAVAANGFLMAPVPGARPTLEQRLLAVALADQVGAALTTSHPVDQS